MRWRQHDHRHRGAGARADHDHSGPHDDQADDDHHHDHRLDHDLLDDLDEGGQRRQRQWGHGQRLSGPGDRKPATRLVLTGRDAEYTRGP